MINSSSVPIVYQPLSATDLMSCRPTVNLPYPQVQQPQLNQVISPVPATASFGVPQPQLYNPIVNSVLQQQPIVQQQLPMPLTHQVNCSQFVNNSAELLWDLEKRTALLKPECQLQNFGKQGQLIFGQNQFFNEEDKFSTFKMLLPLEEQAIKITRPDQIRIKINDIEKELVIITDSVSRKVRLPDSIDAKRLQVRFIPSTTGCFLNQPVFDQPKLLIKAPYKTSRYSPDSCQSLPIEHQLGGLVVKKYFQQLEEIFGSDRRQRLIKTRCVPTEYCQDYSLSYDAYDLAGVRKPRRFQIELALVETKHFLPQQVVVKSSQRKNKITNADEVVVRVEAKRQLETDASLHEVIREFVLPAFVDTSKVTTSVGPFDGTVRIVMPCQFDKFEQHKQEQKVQLK